MIGIDWMVEVLFCTPRERREMETAGGIER